MTPTEFLIELIRCYLDENAGIDPMTVFKETFEQSEPFEHYDLSNLQSLESALDDLEESGVFDSVLWNEEFAGYLSDLSNYVEKCKKII